MGTSTAAPADGVVPQVATAGDESRTDGLDQTVEAAATVFAYRPGLDGLRALALLAVLAFHHGWPGRAVATWACRRSSPCPGSSSPPWR